ncbi:MAG: hypothetical protein DMF80_16285 [Acidobacteria bacterium]|nr:MAG: hypothetical protein DMF80_16285 [Acidobacteriota bacterium]PYQ24074.1 MAG: hypothetical protein DMF81_06740 [Acidobacteriota bacterium]
MPDRAALVLLVAALAAAAGAGERTKTRKPRLGLRATPRFSFTPANVLVTAELNGGDDGEEFYCPALIWDWDDGGRSAHEADCPPFRPGTPLERRFSAEHAYYRPGVYNVTVHMLHANQPLAVASATVTVHGPGGMPGE